jgi:hypothetical protein
VRAWLDGQRETILGCAQQEKALVDARWDATGTVSVSFVGELAASPADGCLRSALGTQLVGARSAGEIRHWVK